MIRIQGLKKKFGQREALVEIDLEIERGELFAYLGPNGAGKTTTIRVLTGLTRKFSGEAWLNGLDVRTETLQARKQCGVVPQANNLDRELSVAQNLDIHGRLFAMPADLRKRRAAELLEKFELSDRANTQVEKLSGGLTRRVLIARALMHSPAILFLDEPTVGLDASIRRKIWTMIKEIQLEGTTVFLTTHYIEEAEFLADRVGLLKKGRLVALDTPGGLMSELGEWALDEFGSGGIQTRYFKSRDQAVEHCRISGGPTTLRRITLEDAYLKRTGERLDEA